MAVATLAQAASRACRLEPTMHRLWNLCSHTPRAALPCAAHKFLTYSFLQRQQDDPPAASQIAVGAGPSHPTFKSARGSSTQRLMRPEMPHFAQLTVICGCAWAARANQSESDSMARSSASNSSPRPSPAIGRAASSAVSGMMGSIARLTRSTESHSRLGQSM